jgi:hypothetical protein
LFVTNNKKKFVDRGPLPAGFESLRSVSDRYAVKHQREAMEEAATRGLMLAAIGKARGSGKEELVDASLSASAEALQKQIDELIGK